MTRIAYLLATAKELNQAALDDRQPDLAHLKETYLTTIHNLTH